MRVEQQCGIIAAVVWLRMLCWDWRSSYPNTISLKKRLMMQCRVDSRIASLGRLTLRQCVAFASGLLAAMFVSVCADSNVLADNVAPPGMFHVSPDGEDASDRSGSVQQAWASLSYACQSVTEPGDTIVIHAGDYIHDNRIVFDRADNPKEGIEIGYGLSDVEISNDFIRNAHYGIALWGNKKGWDISNVSIHHNVFYDLRKNYTFGVFISPSSPETYSNISIANNVFDGVSEGVQILNSDGGLVRNTRVQNNVFMNTPHGVLTIGGKRIRGTLVTHNFYDGDHVYFESDAATIDATVHNNVNEKPDIVRNGVRPKPF